MVRKDPLKERGPAPPGGRRPVIVEGRERARPTTLFELRPEAEYARLWEHLVSTAQNQINNIQHCVDLAMPGVPVAELKKLRDNIDRIIQKEARSHE